MEAVLGIGCTTPYHLTPSKSQLAVPYSITGTGAGASVDLQLLMTNDERSIEIASNCFIVEMVLVEIDRVI